METQIYLLVGIVMFVAGLFIAFSRKNAIMVLVGIELMLNASNLNFLAFSHLYDSLSGQIFSIFVIIIAAAEIAVGLAIIVKLYQYFKNTNIDMFQTLHS
ncbi:MAG: NADH-quinone oxidoreductase subunit NuoK [Raineya sp.]|nr:NADH-quinone oxidoreductase subunit NuoK [Raineya sp.]MDW8295606.1 NADH-quinone oxidoreductase subunit NuoK [Raineya sp.]